MTDHLRSGVRIAFLVSSRLGEGRRRQEAMERNFGYGGDSEMMLKVLSVFQLGARRNKRLRIHQMVGQQSSAVLVVLVPGNGDKAW